MNHRDSIPTTYLRAVLVAFALMMSSCRPQPQAQPKHTELGWRPIASWAGHGNTQTDSFNIGSGQWRIKWEASNEQAPGKGTFVLKVHSLVSGRFVETAVDHQGVGRGVEYVAEEPRAFFLVIESRDIDWTVSVEEGVVGEQEDSR
ncbi:MAG: hypothetical protein ABSA96_09455 [Candidatus Acidiferrales bacterium]